MGMGGLDVPRASSQPASPSGEGAGRQLAGVGILDLPSLGLLDEGGGPDLTGLLCHLLGAKDDKGKTWGQRMVEGWVFDAVEGNPRAIEDILDRIEKWRLARASTPDASPSLGEASLSKILEALCDRGEDEEGDRGDRAGQGAASDEPN